MVITERMLESLEYASKFEKRAAELRYEIAKLESEAYLAEQNAYQWKQRYKEITKGAL